MSTFKISTFLLTVYVRSVHGFFFLLDESVRDGVRYNSTEINLQFSGFQPKVLHNWRINTPKPLGEKVLTPTSLLGTVLQTPVTVVVVDLCVPVVVILVLSLVSSPSDVVLNFIFVHFVVTGVLRLRTLGSIFSLTQGSLFTVVSCFRNWSRLRPDPFVLKVHNECIKLPGNYQTRKLKMSVGLI